MELRIITLIESNAESISAGIQLLRHNAACPHRPNMAYIHNNRTRLKRQSPESLTSRIFTRSITSPFDPPESLLVRDDPVNTHSWFPAIGNLISFFTGNLNEHAGTVINENRDDIKRLTYMSQKFAHMFNTTINIERRHNLQIKQLQIQLSTVQKSLNERFDQLNINEAYQTFLQDRIVMLIEMQRNLDLIFDFCHLPFDI